jgi:uncharacterized membrane protein
MGVPVTLYTGEACADCDAVRDELARIDRVIPVDVVETNVDVDPGLQRELGDRIPVVEVDDTRYTQPFDWETIKAALITAQVRGETSDAARATGAKRGVVLAVDRGILWFSRHWVAALTVLAGLYAGIPFLAPVAMNAGLTGPANVIYRVYSPVCHQFAFRSWFLFGNQPAYPRARADVQHLGTFEEYAGAEPAFDGVDVNVLDGDLVFAAKQFQGSERMGWKVAFCERDVSIYAAIALFGLAFIALKSMGVKVPPLPFWAYLLIAIAPIGLDGFSQLFANPPFNGFGLAWYPIRESTPFLRALTGGLFGLGNAWLAYPYIEESMQDTVKTLERKLSRAGERAPREAEAGANA